MPVDEDEVVADAPSRALGEVEISPSGLGLHRPALDADACVPGLIGGVFGSTGWMGTLDAAPSPAGGADRRFA